MKFVETEAKKTFAPVTLIVESEDELRVLWHRVNVMPSVFEAAGRVSQGFNADSDGAHSSEIWTAVNNAVTARGMNARDVKVRGNV